MTDFFRLSVADALKELDSRVDLGLTDAQVSERQATYGKNALPAGEGTNWVQLVVGQFTDLMVLILIAAAVISFFAGESSDVIVILIIVVLNAALGIYQEYRAEQSLAALSKLQVPQVRVRRDGAIHQISAEDLVPGDIVLLEEGDRIPADGRLIESKNMQIEEAALTGESQPVEKRTDAIASDGNVPLGDRTNMAFMGTSVNYGRGAILITDTGLETELGNIASMLLQVEKGITPLQRRLNQLGQTLALAAGVVVVIVFVAGVLRGIPVREMFLVSISLAVAAVPEGLPAIITIALSLGANRMVRRHALIRRLPAVETLGSVTMICSDKTGTLTKNEMTATQLALPGRDNVRVTGIGYTPQGQFFLENGQPLDPQNDQEVARFLKAMALSTNANLEHENGNGSGPGNEQVKVIGDTTEGALLVAAQKVGWTRDQLENDLPRVAELPFSSERKAMTTVHRVATEDGQNLFPDHGYIAITKGAPDRLIEWANYEHVPDGPRPLTDERRDRWQREVDHMASRGLRVLGVAYRPLPDVPDEVKPDIERDLYLLGLVGIVDPARPEAKDAVQVAREAGIRSVMITGDHALTAEAIARDLGIIQEGQKAVTGNELDKMSDDELSKALDATSAFARVSPEHKLRIVKVLQGKNQVVAMTGDGVNDAPALKQADIGVAMGITGTDVSKGAAEMVLTDDNFASIVASVEEGRIIYDNIRKFVRYLLSCNVGEIFVMFTALMVGLKIPLLAIQILWINLVTDGLPAVALGFEGPESNVMKRPPRPENESIFAGGMGRHIAWVGILIAILTLAGFVYGFLKYDMQPLDATLGLEELSRAQLVEFVPEGAVPANWDELTVEERTTLLEESEGEGEVAAEEASTGLLGEAERVPRTMAFTVLAFVQLFHVMAIHGGDRASFFQEGFSKNRLLLGAVIFTFILQLLVIYVPFLQNVFRTTSLGLDEVLVGVGLSSIVLFAVELEKLIFRRQRTEALVEQQRSVRQQA
ncbi:MAG: cation-translocating P-type ATPase [bacterium]|nr:cation-translocating P-type ATPase [bacterium]